MNLRMKVLLLVLMTVLMLLVGCGVSQENYNAVVAEREAVKAELKLVQNELQGVKTELQSVTTELQSVTNDLSISKSTVQEKEKTIKKARGFAGVISSLFIPVLKGEITTEAEMAMLGISWLGTIGDLDDEKAQRLFDD